MKHRFLLFLLLNISRMWIINVVMQVFRYMVFIWEDYEKEMEK